MAQPADKAPPPAPIPLPTEEDETAAREAHPEAAAAQQRAFEAMVVAKRAGDEDAFSRARFLFLRHAPCGGQNWRTWLAPLSCRRTRPQWPGLWPGRTSAAGAPSTWSCAGAAEGRVPGPSRRDSRGTRRATTRAHVFLLATAEPKHEAAFVLRHKARALRQIGEFIVGPLGSAQRRGSCPFRGGQPLRAAAVFGSRLVNPLRHRRDHHASAPARSRTCPGGNAVS